MRTLIIAEAGVNHNGDMALALQLVEVAASAGADYVKFQTFSADRLVTRTAEKAAYQSARTGGGESQYAMLKRLELTRAMHEELIAHSAKCGIRFMSSGFDAESVDLLDDLGLDCHKIPSGEITNLPYLRHVSAKGKSVILSTGMATLGEVDEALNALEAAGTPRDRIVVLQCNTQYPTPMSDVNLRAMVSMRDAFGVSVGYSDHTEGTEVAIAAVALGAEVIEKHFTVSRDLAGPDHRASLEAAELTEMVRSIRNVEVALGDGVKRRTESESLNVSAARKSLVAARFIRRGESFSEDNLTEKRPGTGISPMRIGEVIGRGAQRDFAPDELIVI